MKARTKIYLGAAGLLTLGGSLFVAGTIAEDYISSQREVSLRVEPPRERRETYLDVGPLEDNLRYTSTIQPER